jgi:hypothetical protein
MKKTENTLPILAPSHRPRLRQSYDPPLLNEQQHAEMVESWLANEPEHFHKTDDVPYGVFITESGEEILFDSSYRPMWRRPGEGYRATRCDPTDFIDWFSVYWLHDNSLTPLEKDFDWKRNISSNTKARLFLRNQLTIIMSEFIDGGELLVRTARSNNPVPQFAGNLISRHPIPNVVLPFRRR